MSNFHAPGCVAFKGFSVSVSLLFSTFAGALHALILHYLLVWSSEQGIWLGERERKITELQWCRIAKENQGKTGIGETVTRPPLPHDRTRAVWTARRSCGEVPTDPEMAQLRVPVLSAFPLLPDHGS